MKSCAKNSNPSLFGGGGPVGAGDPDERRIRGGGGGNASSAFQFLPAWQRERSLRLHKICLGIEDRVNRGQPLTKAARYFAKVNRDKFYRNDPARQFRISYGSIVRLYYVWQSGGKRPEVFELHWHGQKKMTGGDLAAYLRAARHPSVTSTASVRARLRASQPAAALLWASLTERQRRTLLRAWHRRRSCRRPAPIPRWLIPRRRLWPPFQAATC